MFEVGDQNTLIDKVVVYSVEPESPPYIMLLATQYDITALLEIWETGFTEKKKTAIN